MNKSVCIINCKRLEAEKISFLLKEYPEFNCLGFSENYNGSTQLILQTLPDIIIIDIDKNDGNCATSSFDLINELFQSLDYLPTLVALSSSTEKAYEAIKKGFQDFFLKPLTDLTLRRDLLKLKINLRGTRHKKLLIYNEQKKGSEEINNLMLRQQAKLEDGRQQERKRISIELHDAILGRLYGARLSFEFLDINLSSRDLNKFYSLTNELQEIENEIRAISHDLLSKKFFSESGFISLIKDFLSKKNELGLIRFSLRHDEEIDWNAIEEELQINLYRIIQEGVQNCIRHSGAEKAVVDIRKMDKGIILEIIDDGCGFDVPTTNGIGLCNMETRVSTWGGQLIIFSEPDNGTKISASFTFQNSTDE